ncbi:hypothetical protein K438DRAFT_1288561 [Mycena galopus ATCC 62051]|nr:hypothetical protein K438DRAFT_1288561 [Mycena galopus ATCC 62051]
MSASPEPETPDLDTPDTQKPRELYTCYCAHSCGIHGEEVSRATYYRHQRKTKKENEALSMTTSGPQASEESTSSTARNFSPRPNSRVSETSTRDQADSLLQNPILNPNSVQDHDHGGNSVDAMDITPLQSPAPRTFSPQFDPPLMDLDVPMDLSDPPEDDDDDARPLSPRNEPQNLPDDELEKSFHEFGATNKFIAGLREATLEDEKEHLDPDLVHRLRHPIEGVPELDPDERLAIDIFLSLTNASVQTYDSIRAAILRRHPDSQLVSYHLVKKLVADLSGIEPIIHDMCINSCLGYTGAFHDLEACKYCGEPRYDPKRLGIQVP